MHSETKSHYLLVPSSWPGWGFSPKITISSAHLNSIFEVNWLILAATAACLTFLLDAASNQLSAGATIWPFH